MSEKAEETIIPEISPESTPKEKAKKEVKPKVSGPAHPAVAEMVVAAVTSLDEKGGSSSVNIKKFLTSEYKVDVDRLSTYIKKALRNSVATGTLMQTKGKNGSFKLPYYVKNKPKKIKEAKVNKSPLKKSGRGRPKKIDASKAKTVVKADKPKSSGAGRGRPRKDPAEVKPKPVASGRGRGRPKKAA